VAFTISVNSNASGAQRRTNCRKQRSLTPDRGDCNTSGGSSLESLLDLMDEIFNVAKLFELSSIFYCHAKPLNPR
jgi:hypothetical protein